jgi:hypothetical protein
LSSSEIKVSDKRMFTADGQLKEEYQFLESEADGPAPETPQAESSKPESPRDPQPPQPAAREERQPPAASPGPAPPPAREAPHLELPASHLEPGGPTFFDLLALLAEPASVYLGDVPLPGGQSAQDLDLARFHIDLLALLKDRTTGNLTAEEAAVLEDLVYQLRMRYVQKRG